MSRDQRATLPRRLLLCQQRACFLCSQCTRILVYLIYWYKSTNTDSDAARRLDFMFHYAKRMLSMEPVYQSRLGNNHEPTEKKHLADKRDVVDNGRARHVHRVGKEGKELEERVVP